MGAVFFYELQGAPLEVTLPMLIEKARGQGWRVLVRGTDPDLLARLDDALWQGAVDAFLPHGMAGGPHDAEQPVLLGDVPAADFACVMAVGGASVTPQEADDLARACILFDSHDTAKAQAWVQWKALTEAGVAAQYWAQEDGRWVKKAERAAKT